MSPFFLAGIGERVEPQWQVHLLTDEADNRILECAQTGHADSIVTGDQALLALGQYEGVSILSLKKYLTG